MRTNLVAPSLVRSPMTASLQGLLGEKGIRMVEVGQVVDVILRLVCDQTVKGRAVAVHSGGMHDVCDGDEVCDSNLFGSGGEAVLMRCRSTKGRGSMLRRMRLTIRRFGSS